MMKNHTINLYKVNNLSDLDFSYRLVEFDLQLIPGKEDLYNKQLLKIVQKVSSCTSGPAALVKREGNFFVAIPADKWITEKKVDVVPFTVTLKMLEEVYTVNSRCITGDHADVVTKFVDFEIRKQLSNHPQLWELSSGQFFLKQPIFSNEQSSIEIFGGFKYKLVRLEDGHFYICPDLSFKYIDKHYLSHYVNASNNHLISTRYRGRRILYLNGDNWYPAEIVGFGKKIGEQEFDQEGQTYNVYNYIRSRTANHRFAVNNLIRPEDLTLLYKYSGRPMEPHSGAASLAKLIYNTDDPEVRTLHRQSIKDPTRRFEQNNRNIGYYFSGLSFNGKQIKISTTPLVEKISQFSAPPLKFNNDRKLVVGHHTKGGNTSFHEYGAERKQHLFDNGILNKSLFDTQYLIVPEYLEKELISAFKSNAEWQIKKLAPNFPGFTVVRYKVIEGVSATYQVQEISKTLLLNNAQAGFALFVLPDLSSDSKRYIKNFHDCLKTKFYPNLKVQCASASKIKSFFQFYANVNSSAMKEYKVPVDKQSRFRSYMFNLAMEHLIVNRKWPFALANNPHYDIYIGIDVHDRYAGFTFFFKNGEQIYFAPEQVPKKNKSQRAEKIKAGLLYKTIYEKLKMLIPSCAPNPNGIVIVRDGRSFGEEEKALQNVITSLEQDELIKETIKLGVIDLHKQSVIPLRIALQTNGNNSLENPAAGIYKLFSDREGFLFNTGYPFQIPGSAKPLHLSLTSGNVEFIKVMEDLFGQSMLAFSAPDRSNALPITIKLIDTLLEPLSTATDFQEETEEYEEVVLD